MGFRILFIHTSYTVLYLSLQKTPEPWSPKHHLPTYKEESLSHPWMELATVVEGSVNRTILEADLLCDGKVSRGREAAINIGRVYTIVGGECPSLRKEVL